MGIPAKCSCLKTDPGHDHDNVVNPRLWCLPEGHAVGETGKMVRTTVLPQLIPRVGEGGHGRGLYPHCNL